MAVLTLGAIVAAQVSGLPGFARLLLSVLGLLVGMGAVLRFVRPALRIRLLQDAVEYRAGPRGPWRRMEAGRSCFVSPWFIGWRGRERRAFGVFRGQLSPDDFRRLSVRLRHPARD